MAIRRPAARIALALCLASAACHRSPVPIVAAASNASDSASGGPGPAVGMTHGDHNPHHGGTVYMYADLHYEVVLDPHGHHRVYFSDSAREDLPAAVASSVTLTLEGPTHEKEKLTGAIDPQGESWRLEGRPVLESDTAVRVAFIAKGDQYWIDVPFIASTQ